MNNTPASKAVALAALTAAVMQAGCTLSVPSSAPSPTTTTRAPNPTTATSAPRDAGDPAPERGGRIPPAAQATQQALAPRADSATPRGALERYANLAINWTWRNLADRERRLASISLGQARAQALATAAQAGANPALRAHQVTNAGRSVSIAPGRGAAAARWVIVTAEQTSGTGPYTGLPQTLHITYAQVTHTPSGYLVSQWHPVN